VTRVGPAWSSAATWAVSRDVHFCDSCDDGYDPGNGGSGSSRLLDASDLSLGTGRSWDVVSAGLTAALPASRDSLVCNPLYGALGVVGGAGLTLAEVGVGTQVAVTRSFYAHAAAPVGRSGCSEPLADYSGTETLAGVVEPDAWAGERYAAQGANADWSGRLLATVSDVHTLVASPPRLTTELSVGLAARHTRVAEAQSVATASGEVTVDASQSPVVWSWPAAIGTGVRWNERLSSALTLANQVPRQVHDTAGFYRSLPAATSLSLSLTGSL